MDVPGSNKVKILKTLFFSPTVGPDPFRGVCDVSEVLAYNPSLVTLCLSKL